MKNQNLPLFLLLLLAFGCAGTMRNERSDTFVKVSGTGFTLDGRPHYFGGVNFWYGLYLGSPGPTGDRPRLLRELDSLHAMGITNLRVLAGSEESAIERTVRPTVQTAPGIFDEDLLKGLDVLLDEMARREMRAVVYLSNYWEWSGGFGQYMTWAEGKDIGVDPWDTTQGWGMFMDFSARLYSNEKALGYYLDFVRTIITRRNTVSGVLYRDDPTIMSWQLANEPRPGTVGPNGEANMDAFVRWVDSTARLIKALDPLHLVSAGSEGSVGTLLNEEYYIRAYSSPAVDYLNLHVWPYNWGWFDPHRSSETVGEAERRATEYIARHIALARTIGKPLTMEEFGLARDGLNNEPGSPATARNRYFRTVLSMVADSAAAGAPIAGTNVWAWGGEARAQHPDFRWRPGDPFTGDPPHESQGLNSIFNEDVETKQIIREHAHRMNAISR